MADNRHPHFATSVSLSSLASSSADGLLAGRRLLITGVLNRHSIAWHIAAAAQGLGAEVTLSTPSSVRRHTSKAAAALPQKADVVELDITDPATVERAAAGFERLDGLVHAIAFGAPETVGGSFLATSAEAAAQAFTVSAHSLALLASEFSGALQAADHGAIVGLSFETRFALPGYNWMGVAKSALEATNRYVARDLGAVGVRANLVSAGPLRSFAARSVPGFDELGRVWTAQAPLGWDVRDAAPVADACCLLLSPLARAITGEVVHVDGGVHAVIGTALSGADAS